jgi:hypothetical protein
MKPEFNHRGVVLQTGNGDNFILTDLSGKIVRKLQQREFRKGVIEELKSGIYFLFSEIDVKRVLRVFVKA